MNDNYNKTKFIGSLYGHGQSYAGAIFDKEWVCPTLTTMQGGGREPHIIVGDNKQCTNTEFKKT